VTLLRIASDWHLAPESPAVHARLAQAFLARAHAERAEVILNGDVFDELFAGPGRGQAAHPEVVAGIERLRCEGRLRRTAGNHDPDAGAARLLLEWPGVGRVLVTHGHLADPVNRSPVGRLGDAISRRFGRLGIVRGAARLAEVTARAALGDRLVSIFRGRCLAFVRQEGVAVGIFGHVHVAHLAPGDAYVNAGALTDDRLEYLELSPAGLRLGVLRAGDPSSGLEGGTRPEMR
jgi:predicted phosphodiesterase